MKELLVRLKKARSVFTPPPHTQTIKAKFLLPFFFVLAVLVSCPSSTSPIPSDDPGDPKPSVVIRITGQVVVTDAVLGSETTQTLTVEFEQAAANASRTAFPGTNFNPATGDRYTLYLGGDLQHKGVIEKTGDSDITFKPEASYGVSPFTASVVTATEGEEEKMEGLSFTEPVPLTAGTTAKVEEKITVEQSNQIGNRNNGTWERDTTMLFDGDPTEPVRQTLIVNGNGYIYEQYVYDGGYTFTETGTFTYTGSYFILNRNMQFDSYGRKVMAFMVNFSDDENAIVFVGSEAEELYISGSCFARAGTIPDAGTGVLEFHVHDILGYGPWDNVDDLFDTETGASDYEDYKADTDIEGIFKDQGLTEEITGTDPVNGFTRFFISFEDAQKMGIF
jgi:hypothetical protein